MKLNQIDSSTKINPLGREIKIGFEDSDIQKAVLLLHGYGGKSTNWLYAAEKINETLKLPVLIPRLPGHATNITDFLNSDSDQWLRKALDSYLELSSNYQEVYVAGLSMGGLLAALLAAQFKVKKLSLVAPAFFTKNKNIVFTPYLKYFIKKLDNGFELDSENSTPAEIDFHQNYSFNYYTSALAELYKLIKKGRKAAAEINTKTQLILSENDDQVENSEIKVFLNKKMGQFLVDQKIYQKSSHVITNDVEKERCAQDIIDFFKE
ncbi:alpha/beta hydrolase [Halanaerobium congolense]|uniref:Carboxylesterase n=1 Tax=Halanaerobium congolense TaxID=54121 RepID=A0A318ECM0_9FIRM|nr:alpha/beta fold hydrolase [Halanaerobium congolense]PXV69344.1 esterase/lipase [Halanaerobium congolense]TDS33706.1 carboxylesterase [Halanaerobium congolense]